MIKEGNLVCFVEMGIVDFDKVYEVEELVCGEYVCFVGSGIMDGLFFDGVKFEKDCICISSLVISNLDNICCFINIVYIKDGV